MYLALQLGGVCVDASELLLALRGLLPEAVNFLSKRPNLGEISIRK
jgi:hypothetical protein